MPMPDASRTKIAIDQRLGRKRGALAGDLIWAAGGVAAGMRGAVTAGPVGDLRKPTHLVLMFVCGQSILVASQWDPNLSGHYTTLWPRMWRRCQRHRLDCYRGVDAAAAAARLVATGLAAGLVAVAVTGAESQPP